MRCNAAMLWLLRDEVVSDASRFRPGLDRTATFRLPLRVRLSLRCLRTTSSPSDMVLNSESKYPSRRAYVLKLRADAAPARLAGRIENLVTGRQVEFASAQELVESLLRELEAEATERPADPDGV